MEVEKLDKKCLMCGTLRQPMTLSWKFTRHILHNMLTYIGQYICKEAEIVYLLLSFLELELGS